MDHNEDIDKEIHISLSIFWDIAVQGGNEVMRSLTLISLWSRSMRRGYFYIHPPGRECFKELYFE